MGNRGKLAAKDVEKVEQSSSPVSGHVISVMYFGMALAAEELFCIAAVLCLPKILQKGETL